MGSIPTFAVRKRKAAADAPAPRPKTPHLTFLGRSIVPKHARVDLWRALVVFVEGKRTYPELKDLLGISYKELVGRDGFELELIDIRQKGEALTAVLRWEIKVSLFEQRDYVFGYIPLTLDQAERIRVYAHERTREAHMETALRNAYEAAGVTDAQIAAKRAEIETRVRNLFRTGKRKA